MKSVFEIPPLERLPIPFNHWGEVLKEENYGMLWQAGSHLIRGLQAYHWHHQRPGDFLCSVLANDLVGAITRADPVSLALMRQLLWYVHNEMPAPMHGSWQIVDSHSPNESQGVSPP